MILFLTFWEYGQDWLFIVRCQRHRSYILGLAAHNDVVRVRDTWQSMLG
uniref:Uncharacterized protein n=1 Tax=Rhizophora mucronata TaxID=61149 RepID=A0A2P2NIK8_RHIMU